MDLSSTSPLSAASLPRQQPAQPSPAAVKTAKPALGPQATPKPTPPVSLKYPTTSLRGRAAKNPDAAFASATSAAALTSDLSRGSKPSTRPLPPTPKIASTLSAAPNQDGAEMELARVKSMPLALPKAEAHPPTAPKPPSTDSHSPYLRTQLNATAKPADAQSLFLPPSQIAADSSLAKRQSTAVTTPLDSHASRVRSSLLPDLLKKKNWSDAWQYILSEIEFFQPNTASSHLETLLPVIFETLLLSHSDKIVDVKYKPLTAREFCVRFIRKCLHHLRPELQAKYYFETSKYFSDIHEKYLLLTRALRYAESVQIDIHEIQTALNDIEDNLIRALENAGQKEENARLQQQAEQNMGQFHRLLQSFLRPGAQFQPEGISKQVEASLSLIEQLKSQRKFAIAKELVGNLIEELESPQLSLAISESCKQLCRKHALKETLQKLIQSELDSAKKEPLCPSFRLQFQKNLASANSPAEFSVFALTFLQTILKACAKIIQLPPLQYMASGSHPREAGTNASDFDLAVLCLKEHQKLFQQTLVMPLHALINFYLACSQDTWIILENGLLVSTGCKIDPGDTENITNTEHSLLNTPEDMERFVFSTLSSNSPHESDFQLAYSLLHPYPLFATPGGEKLYDKFVRALQARSLIDSRIVSGVLRFHQKHFEDRKRLSTASSALSEKFGSHLVKPAIGTSWERLINLKESLISPLTYWCLDMALACGMVNLPTIPKIVEALKSGQCVAPYFCDALLDSWHFLMQTRWEAHKRRKGVPNEQKNDLFLLPETQSTSVTLPSISLSQFQKLQKIDTFVCRLAYDCLQRSENSPIPKPLNPVLEHIKRVLSLKERSSANAQTSLEQMERELSSIRSRGEEESVVAVSPELIFWCKKTFQSLSAKERESWLLALMSIDSLYYFFSTDSLESLFRLLANDLKPPASSALPKSVVANNVKAVLVAKEAPKQLVNEHSYQSAASAAAAMSSLTSRAVIDRSAKNKAHPVENARELQNEREASRQYAGNKIEAAYGQEYIVTGKDLLDLPSAEFSMFSDDPDLAFENHQQRERLSTIKVIKATKAEMKYNSWLSHNCNFLEKLYRYLPHFSQLEILILPNIVPKDRAFFRIISHFCPQLRTLDVSGFGKQPFDPAAYDLMQGVLSETPVHKIYCEFIKTYNDDCLIYLSTLTNLRLLIMPDSHGFYYACSLIFATSLPDLELLDISHTDFEPNSLKHLVNLKNLKYLNITECKLVSGKYIKKIRKHNPSITIVDNSASTTK